MDGCAWRRHVGTPGGGLGHSKEGMVGWRWNHRGVGATVPLLTSVSWGSFCLENVHIITCTITYAHLWPCTVTPLGFPPICWTWNPSQELSIERAGLGFMYLTSVVRSIVKVINMEGEDQPLLFPSVLLHLQSQQTLSLTGN